MSLKIVDFGLNEFIGPDKLTRIKQGTVSIIRTNIFKLYRLITSVLRSCAKHSDPLQISGAVE
jgi:hypothetical protein